MAVVHSEDIPLGSSVSERARARGVETKESRGVFSGLEAGFGHFQEGELKAVIR